MVVIVCPQLAVASCPTIVRLVEVGVTVGTPVPSIRYRLIVCGAPCGSMPLRVTKIFGWFNAACCRSTVALADPLGGQGVGINGVKMGSLAITCTSVRFWVHHVIFTTS